VVRQLILAALIVTATLTGPASAQRQWGHRNDRIAAPYSQEKFQVLDTQTGRSREDRIVFRLERRDGRIRAIKFRPLKHRMLLIGVEIRFANGERQTANIFRRLRAGEESQVIDLDGEARRVDTVTLIKRPHWRRGRRNEVELIGLEVRERRRDRDRDRDRRGSEFELVGSETVDARDDRVVFKVGRREGRFNAIKFRSSGRSILLSGVDIEFANGDRQEVRLLQRLRSGRETEAIDLKGKSRRIKKITLWKRPSWRPGRVTVDLGGSKARGRDRKRLRGWTLLGTRKASMFEKDRDVLRLGKKYGRFKAIRLTARREDVRIYSVRVVYGNGEVERLPISVKLREDRTTEAFDLRGRGRYIDRIELKYRSKLTLKGRAKVEVWGLY
jgi:hypothetical protein